MGAFFGFIFGLWMIGVFVTWPYFWAKKTDRSQAPITRRGIGLLWALAWPYHIFSFFSNRNQAHQARTELQSAHNRILGSSGDDRTAPPAPVAPPPPSGTIQSSIKNPFDI